MKLLSQAVLTIALAMPAFTQQPMTAPGGATASADDATKLIALNALMNADPDRAIPLLDGILKGNSSPTLKDRSMSVLTQSKSPRAQPLVTDYAKSSADPDLQLRAIRNIGRSGTKDTQQQLAAVYPTATDTRVKQEIIRSLMSSGASDSLLTIAKSEKDQTLRNEAIRDLAASESTPASTLTGLYSTETDPAARKTIVSMLAGRGDAKSVIEMGRKETDPAMKSYIVQRLAGMTKNKDAMDYMTELLK
jgi:hypothetical protein